MVGTLRFLALVDLFSLSQLHLRYPSLDQLIQDDPWLDQLLRRDDHDLIHHVGYLYCLSFLPYSFAVTLIAWIQYVLKVKDWLQREFIWLVASIFLSFFSQLLIFNKLAQSCCSVNFNTARIKVKKQKEKLHLAYSYIFFSPFVPSVQGRGNVSLIVICFHRAIQCRQHGQYCQAYESGWFTDLCSCICFLLYILWCFVINFIII